jgi:hypothetical protein
MFVEIVTREGGSGKVKYVAYIGFMTAKSDMSFSNNVTAIICWAVRLFSWRSAFVR